MDSIKIRENTHVYHIALGEHSRRISYDSARRLADMTVSFPIWTVVMQSRAQHKKA